MKRAFYLLINVFVLQIVTSNVHGQTQLYAPNNGSILNNSANSSVIVASKLGVGNNAWNPQATFQVYDDQWSWPVSIGGFLPGEYDNTGYSANYLGFNIARTSSGQLRAEKDGSNNGGALIAGGINGSLRFMNFPTNNGANPQLLSLSTFNNYQTMMLTKDHKVVIGSINTPYTFSTAGNYKLFVETGIITEKIKVALVANWSDFVFANNYKLRPLTEVESYIKENKHLPEIPSAEEVRKDGVDLIEMDVKLLQKVEELTLYIIEMQKKIDVQQKELEQVRLKNGELEQMLLKK